MSSADIHLLLLIHVSEYFKIMKVMKRKDNGDDEGEDCREGRDIAEEEDNRVVGNYRDNAEE